MRLRRTALITLATIFVAGLAAGLVERQAEAQTASSPWSATLLRNGDFSDGQTPWELAPRWSDTRPDRQPSVNSGDSDAALAIPLHGRTSTCADYTGVAIQQRIDIDDQLLQHDLRLTLRFRVDAIEPARARLAVAVYGERVGDASGARALLYISLDPVRQIQLTPRVPVSPGEWTELVWEFPLQSFWPMGAITLDLEPLVSGRAGLCYPNGQFVLDDVTLQSKIAAEPTGAFPFPRLNRLLDSDIAGATELINAYRFFAETRPLTYDAAASAGARAHVHYLARNPESTPRHYEDPLLPGHTPEGDQAARTSRICWNEPSLTSCVESLLTVPYHRLGLLAADAGYGRWGLRLGFEGGFGVVGTLAAGRAPASARRDQSPPVIWPADGLSGVPSRLLISELPDPLTLCPEIPPHRVVGYPITAEFPFLERTRPVTEAIATLATADGASIPVCTIDAQIPHPDLQQYLPAGQPAEGSPGKWIFIPVQPLEPNQIYRFTVSATVNGAPGEWSVTFTTRGAPPLTAESLPAGFAWPSDGETPLVQIPLQPGWNLVGWTAAESSVREAVARMAGRFESVLAWDAEETRFQSFSAAAPASLNTLQQLQRNEGVWVHASTAGVTTWPQPRTTGARVLRLQPGYNLVVWTGPDDTPITWAISGIRRTVVSAWKWDAATQRFLTHDPRLPDTLNTLTTLHYGDGLWISVSDATIWPQPEH